MDGFVLSIYHNDQEQMFWTNLLLDAESEAGEALNDAVYLRNRAVEDRFNCKIETTEFNGFPFSSSEISKEVMAGDSTYDVWFPRDDDLADSIPYIRPLNDLPYVNLSAEWWFPNASSVLVFGDKQYSATSAFSLSMIARAGALAFNKDMYENIRR